MKLSEMFELKKDKTPKEKKNRMPYEIFVGIIFLLCSIVQEKILATLFETYNIPTPSISLAILALLIGWGCKIVSFLCFSDHVYKTNKKLGIIMLIFTIMIAFFATLFTVIGLLEVLNG